MKTLLIISTFVMNHKIALGLLLTAGIKVMPAPGQPFHPYDFVYDWIHQYLNIPNLRLTPVAVISPPAPINAAIVPPKPPQFNS